jgi:hypothetical protein
MSELDPFEATRREFDAVMRLSRFASIEQVAADLAVLAERSDARTAPRCPTATASAAPSALPSRAART